jgi:hypothetical protein
MKRLDGPPNVEFINNKFFSHHTRASDINQGECFLWAYLAYRLYKNVELWDMGAHAFVRDKVTGKFYDSERPQGEEDWKELPATNWGQGCGCSRCQQPARKFNVARKFRKAWIGMTKKHKVQWEAIDLKIKKVIEEYGT